MPRSSISRILSFVLAAVFVGGFTLSAAAEAARDTKAPIPNLGVLWAKVENEYFKAPKNGAGPPMSLPLIKGILFEADYRNPTLKPWVAETLKKYQEMDKSGVQVAPAITSSCFPYGVPGIDAPHYVLDLIQTPKMVVLLYNSADQVRFVYLDQPHSKHVPLTWYGESVGHYEGDTLVVDTVGLKAGKMSVIDTFGTPHTDQLHVIERFHVINGGKTLRIDLHVDDPGAFTTPFDAIADLAKTEAPKGSLIPEYIGKGHNGAFEERICDNNRSRGIAPMPTASKPDF